MATHILRPMPLSRREALFRAAPYALIRIHTFQHRDAWAQAQTRGYFTGGATLAKDAPWPLAYEWMREEMARRVPGFSGDFPVWAYAKRPVGKRKYMRGDEVLITARVPRRRLLFSDHETWHIPLNGGFISSSEAEDDAWDVTQDVRITWDRCLDICRPPSRWLGTNADIQACVDRLYLPEIVSVKGA